jgi:putative membrane protein
MMSTMTASTDPESRARTHLANERTFLAWFRTGVTLIALGIAVAQFLGQGSDESFATLLLGCAVVIGGIALLLIGRSRYFRSRRQIDDGSYRPAALSVDMAVTLFAIIGALAIGIVVLLRT